MMYDGLFCAFDQVAMGAGTEKYAASAGLERAPQDELAAKSHQRAAAAAKNGLFDDEIVPVEVPQRGATRSSSRRTRASAATPPPRASAASAPRSTRPATSPPATPARSPTAAPR